MTESEKEAALNDLHARLAAAGAPPAWLLAIIQAIMSLLGGGICPAPKATVASHPLLFQLRTRRELRQQGVPISYLSQSTVAVTLVTTNATDEDVARCIACAE